jgi:hypothetical protein
MAGQLNLWIVAGSALAITILASFADRLRSRRRNLDQAGWVPWHLVQIIAMITAAVAAAFALKS